VTDKTSAKDVLLRLERLGTRKTRDGMARYGIVAKKALGVTMTDLKVLAKSLGRDHALAAALWDTGVYEARLLAALVDDAQQVTPAQMDRWCGGFENWADGDTACFLLFDRTPHAFGRVDRWARRPGEYEKRAAFALLASLALHDRTSPDAAFSRRLPLVEKAALDERNFVKKGVSWALRSIGRRSAALRAAALESAGRLAASPSPAARWVGKDALRDLAKKAAVRRIATDRKKTTGGQP
jgi:3-methyladenine DNA glycosylase AlkD